MKNSLNKNLTPILEDFIREKLTGEKQQNALDFVAHLRAGDESGDFSICYDTQWGENIWLAKKKGEDVCYINVFAPHSPDFWMQVLIRGDHIGEHAAMTVDEHVKEVAWANVTSCGDCGANCGPEKRRRTVLGKGFDNVCTTTIMFNNPDAATFDCIKIITDVRKNDIRNHA